jgi:hypothetical protein
MVVNVLAWLLVLVAIMQLSSHLHGCLGCEYAIISHACPAVASAAEATAQTRAVKLLLHFFVTACLYIGEDIWHWTTSHMILL